MSSLTGSISDALSSALFVLPREDTSDNVCGLLSGTAVGIGA